MVHGRTYRKKKTVLQNAKKHTGAKAQSKQIGRLAKQVDNLKVKTRELTIPVNYHCGYSSRTNEYPLIIPLTSGPKSGTSGTATTNNDPVDIMNWIKWGSYPGPAVSADAGRLRLYSQYVDLQVEPGGEVDLLNHTLFVVQLRDDSEGMARQTYRRTANMTVMELDTDFVTNPDNNGASAWLNPQLYRIHKRYECHTVGASSGGEGPEIIALMQNHSGGLNRFGFKLTYGGRQLRATGTSSELQSIAYNDIPPEYKYFIIAFSDNSVIDLENPLISVHSTIATRMS